MELSSSSEKTGPVGAAGVTDWKIYRMDRRMRPNSDSLIS